MAICIKKIKISVFVSFSLNRLFFYHFAVIFNGMPNITVNYSDCHLPAEIVEVCMFGNEAERSSVNLVIMTQTL